MGKVVEGVISKISERPWEGADGETVKLYSFQVQGGNKWYRTGQTPLKFPEGTYVRFQHNDKMTVEKGSMERVEGSAPPPSSAPSSGGGGGGTSRDGYWAEKEARDIQKEKKYQAVDVPRMSFSAAQERAVHLVAAALAHDVLGFGTMKKGDKLDALLGYVEQVTNKFFMESMRAHEIYMELATAEPVDVEQEAPAAEASDDE